MYRLLDLFFPPRCPYCGKVIAHKSKACEKCAADFPDNPCVKLLDNGSICTSPFEYSGKYKDSVLAFKFGNKPYYAPQLAAAVYEAVLQEFNYVTFDYVTFVPLSAERLKERGYNQAQLIAKELAKLMHIECADVLQKAKRSKTQHELKRKDRRKNVQGVYNYNGYFGSNPYNILICDDICTTGFTLAECCKIIESGSACRAYGAAVTIVK